MLKDKLFKAKSIYDQEFNMLSDQFIDMQEEVRFLKE